MDVPTSSVQTSCVDNGQIVHGIVDDLTSEGFEVIMIGVDQSEVGVLPNDPTTLAHYPNLKVSDQVACKVIDNANGNDGMASLEACPSLTPPSKGYLVGEFRGRIE